MGPSGGRVSFEARAKSLSLIADAVFAGASKTKACEYLNLNIRTIERWEKISHDRRCGPNTRPSNALSMEERALVVATANSSEYANLSPSQIVPKLADAGKYIGSESSFYRILKEEKLLNHRSKSNPKKHCKPKELVALDKNQIWSWDITYLNAAIKGTFYYLYLPMDIFSRKIVHWDIFENESAENASKMINQACLNNNISFDQLILHSDNGSPMKGATMLATLQRLGVMPSFSRPSVSNDNPYSESLFKTLKYCPSYPEKGFSSLEEAKKWVSKFVTWYNNEHFHSGINFVTPASKHDGLDNEILKKRHEIYQIAQQKNPSRWSKDTRNWSEIKRVELNPGKESKMKEKLAA